MAEEAGSDVDDSCPLDEMEDEEDATRETFAGDMAPHEV
jgi:hypothetical protein